jgi:hypothetical protein
MNHMNELVLNLLIWILGLLNQSLHAVYYHYSDKDPAKFELSLT